MWRELARDLYPQSLLAAAASEIELQDVEATLSVRLPEELRALLRETDGILDKWEKSPVMPAYKIKSLNTFLRTELADLYPTFQSHLFIAEGAGGDLWGYKIHSDRTITDKHIYVWEHELAEEQPDGDSYFVQADDLQSFVTWYLAELVA